MSSASLKRNECKRQCRYNYTEAERLEKGRALADEYGTLDAVNADLERVKKDFKARIETHEAKIQSLAEQVRSGYELRETTCIWQFNRPTPGRKTLVRADTFEVIGEEDMTGADTQLVMEVIDAAGEKPTDDFPKAEAPLALVESVKVTKKTATTTDKLRRASRGGVIACESDGNDIDGDGANKDGVN